MTIYNYSVTKPNGEVISMETYRNNPLLIVNTANHCRFTYQLEDLQKLYEKYSDRGLIVLGFPSNQFAEQNPEDGQATQELCKLNYGVKFPIFEVVDVNGENTHPLFNYLKQSVECREFGENLQEKVLKSKIEEMYPLYFQGNNIHWNFTKFLVDTEGKVIKRFEPTDSHLDIEAAVEALL